MVRHKKSRRFSRRRGVIRSPRRSSMKSKLVKALTLGIAVGPEAFHAIDTYRATGSFQQVGVDLVSAYSGYNMNDGKFYAIDLARGYAPIVAAVIFRKALGILRV